MKCLIVVANPSDTSFTNALVAQFKSGLESDGHTHETIQLFQEDYVKSVAIDADYRQMMLDADAICFAFPWWFEMPPFPLVAFFQRNFVEGFAFRHEDGKKIPLLNKKVQLMITMGQSAEEYNIYCVREGLRYVGLPVTNELTCVNVGPRLSPEKAQEYLNRANQAGKFLFKQ